MTEDSRLASRSRPRGRPRQTCYHRSLDRKPVAVVGQRWAECRRGEGFPTPARHSASSFAAAHPEPFTSADIARGGPQGDQGAIRLVAEKSRPLEGRVAWSAGVIVHGHASRAVIAILIAITAWLGPCTRLGRGSVGRLLSRVRHWRWKPVSPCLWSEQQSLHPDRAHWPPLLTIRPLPNRPPAAKAVSWWSSLISRGSCRSPRLNSSSFRHILAT